MRGTRAIEVFCAECKSSPGSPCLSRTGMAVSFHRARINQASRITRESNLQRATEDYTIRFRRGNVEGARVWEFKIYDTNGKLVAFDTTRGDRACIEDKAKQKLQELRTAEIP